MSSTSQMKAVGVSQRPGIETTLIDYHGWRNSYLLSNGIAEVVVVPAIGRVMQFRMADEEEGVFWENRGLDGELPSAPESEWANFGGDKTWPAPQDDWARIAGRPWPPPPAFDSMQLHATQEGESLVLTSPVDTDYGIRTVRYVTLHSTEAKLSIRTSFCKVSGESIKVGVWVITQLRDPQLVSALLPEQPKRKPGYYQMQGSSPFDFAHDGRLVFLRRDPANNSKVGAEGNSLLWVGEKYTLRIDHDSAAGATSIYTNMDPLQYVELETEGPVVEMRCGESIELKNTYEMSRRTTPDSVAEARRVFGLE